MATVYEWAGLNKALVINLISWTFWFKPIYFTVTWSRREAVTIIDRSKLLTGGKGGVLHYGIGPVAIGNVNPWWKWMEWLISLLFSSTYLNNWPFLRVRFFSPPWSWYNRYRRPDWSLSGRSLSTGCFFLHLFMYFFILLNCPSSFRPSLVPCADRHVAEGPKCAMYSQRPSPAALKY